MKRMAHSAACGTQCLFVAYVYFIYMTVCSEISYHISKERICIGIGLKMRGNNDLWVDLRPRPFAKRNHWRVFTFYYQHKQGYITELIQRNEIFVLTNLCFAKRIYYRVVYYYILKIPLSTGGAMTCNHLLQSSHVRELMNRRCATRAAQSQGRLCRCMGIERYRAEMTQPSRFAPQSECDTYAIARCWS